MTERIGCIGLGSLGMAIAERLVAAGFPVFGYRRSSMQDFEAIGGRAAASPADVMRNCDVVITCLPSGEALERVALGDQGLASAARRGQVLLEVTTAALDAKTRVRDELERLGVDMLDCPISGRPNVVRAGEARVFVSGDDALAARMRPIFEALSQRHIYVGPFGSGSKMKYIANLLLTIHVMAVAEAVELGNRAGFAPELILDALQWSAASSEQLRIRIPTIARGSRPAAEGSSHNYHEDLLVIRDFVAETGSPTPLFSTALHHYEQAEAEGFGDQDNVLMFTQILRKIAGNSGNPSPVSEFNGSRGSQV